MSMQILLGFAGIAMGLRSISSGLKKIESASKGLPARSAQKASPRSFVATPTGPIRLRTYNIRGLEDRIKHLQKLVRAGKKDPVVYEFARRAVNGQCGKSWCVPEKDNLAEAKALFRAVRQQVRYTSDIAGVDSYQKPAHTLTLRTGDCDDYSVLACSLAGTLGMPCRFKVIRTQGAPTWNHIYAQIGLPRRNPRKWISFDASVAMPFGWEAPKSMVAESRTFLSF